MGRKKKTESNDSQKVVEKRVTRLSRSTTNNIDTNNVSKPQTKRKKTAKNVIN